MNVTRTDRDGGSSQRLDASQARPIGESNTYATIIVHRLAQLENAGFRFDGAQRQNAKVIDAAWMAWMGQGRPTNATPPTAVRADSSDFLLGYGPELRFDYGVDAGFAGAPGEGSELDEPSKAWIEKATARSQGPTRSALRRGRVGDDSSRANKATPSTAGHDPRESVSDPNAGPGTSREASEHAAPNTMGGNMGDQSGSFLLEPMDLSAGGDDAADAAAAMVARMKSRWSQPRGA